MDTWPLFKNSMQTTLRLIHFFFTPLPNVYLPCFSQYNNMNFTSIFISGLIKQSLRDRSLERKNLGLFPKPWFCGYLEITFCNQRYSLSANIRFSPYRIIGRVYLGLFSLYIYSILCLKTYRK